MTPVFGTTTDITEHLDMAEKLQQQATAPHLANKRKDEFLATLAHELRNPLAPIRNSLAIQRLRSNAGALLISSALAASEA